MKATLRTMDPETLRSYAESLTRLADSVESASGQLAEARRRLAAAADYRTGRPHGTFRWRLWAAGRLLRGLPGHAATWVEVADHYATVREVERRLAAAAGDLAGLPEYCDPSPYTGPRWPYPDPPPQEKGQQ